jgi:hypothetical protein
VSLSDPAQVDAYLSARVEPEGDCWLWTRSLNNRGYGQVQLADHRGLAHRFSYEYHRAEIPAGLHLDHLCRNRRCINPWHLEPVTQRENNIRSNAPSAIAYRSNTCTRGHARTAENTYHAKNGKRFCRTCHNATEMRRRRRLKDAGVARYWEAGATKGVKC